MSESWIKKVGTRLLQFLVPRPHLANVLFEDALGYEQRLREQRHIDPQIIEAIVAERERIRVLFEEQVPEYAGRVVVCVMQPHQTPLGVFVWEDRLFVLVSATQIGHPIDHPDDPGLLAWPWLVQHEAVHIRRGHLRSMFWVRHIHRMVYLATSAVFLFWCILPETPMLNALIRECGAAWALAWLVQTGFCLGCEWKADRGATARMQDPAVLEETKKTLKRMTQIGAGPGSAVRWVIYALNVLLVDPHPPLRARLWLLNRRLRQLDNLRH